MKNLIKTVLVIIALSLPFAGSSQVLMKEMLTQNQKGTLDKSVNWPGKKIYFELKYDSTRTFKYDGKESARYYYTLMIADNAGMGNAIKVPTMVRDLVITTYFELYLSNGTETKTFTLVYDKNNKWYRIKFAPQAGCRREELWKRENNIASYTDMLGSMVGQMDNNLKLDCYRGNESKVVME